MLLSIIHVQIVSLRGLRHTKKGIVFYNADFFVNDKELWARICKRSRSPGIDFKESIPPICVVWRADTSNRVVVPIRQSWNRFLAPPPLKGLQYTLLDDEFMKETPWRRTMVMSLVNEISTDQLGNRVAVRGMLRSNKYPACPHPLLQQRRYF
jgi:hypothetical protein